ncbi:MAG: DegT/DnrJ/EryC1/StrS family aminotransferase [Mobilitalea sp.]
MNNKKIYLASPTMNGKEIDFINEAFDTNWVAPLGPNVNGFEKELAEYVGIPYATALISGTAAIHLALKSVGISQGDIVFCSSLTFSATCNPILYQGAVPVFIDSEKNSWNMDPEALSKAFKKYPNAKAVIIVHLYGTPAKLDEIIAICNEHKVPLIEDAAESLGATYHSKQTGTFGRFGIFSFNGNKIITTSGGGMLVSEDSVAIEKARFWSTQSRENERHYEHKEVGYNYRMSNIVAGIGRGQLLSLKEHIRLKKRIYNIYKEAFNDISDIVMNPIPDQCEPNFWLSCITLQKESKVKSLDILLALEKENIEARPIWKPMHLQPVFDGCDFIMAEGVNESVAEDIFIRGVCLPSDIKNTEEDMERIIGIIQKLFGR